MGSYNIPLFDLNYGEEEIAAVTETLKSKWISMGPKCQELEEIFCEKLNVKYAVAVTNCTAALHLSLYALGIKEGDEVICPSLTFAATVNCIKYVGATPVFCDIKSKEDLGIDADMVESLITPRTKAIIPMHFAGFPCDMDKIVQIARKYDLYVVEDACHGPLSEYHGKKLGTIGDVGCFSFFSNKNISTGEGGMVVTNDFELYEKIKLCRSHGMTTMSYQRAKGHATGYDILALGFNYRMDDIRASLGCVQMRKLSSDLVKRAAVRERLVDGIRGIGEIAIPYCTNTEYVSNYIFPIVLKNGNREKRDLIRKRLQDHGIQTSVHYPAVHRFSIYSDVKCELPVTEYVTDNEITLPMYAGLSSENIEYICKELQEAVDTV